MAATAPLPTTGAPPPPAPDRLLGFPDPVNELAARTVAAGVVVQAGVTLAAPTTLGFIALAYGFVARVLTGPRLSPLGQVATRVVAPRLGPPRPTPGPPKRFAQGIGAGLSVGALGLWLAGRRRGARLLLLPLLAAAGLEAALGLCLGCRIFSVLMAAGIIPERVCPECADLTRRHPGLQAEPAQPAEVG